MILFRVCKAARSRGERVCESFFFFASELASDRVKLSEDFAEGILRNNIFAALFVCLRGVFD